MSTTETHVDRTIPAARRPGVHLIQRSILLIAAAFVVLLAACGADGGGETATGSNGAPPAAASAELPSTVDIETTDFTFTPSSTAVAAGPVTVRLTNHGDQDHQVQIGRTRRGVTAETFMQVFHDEGEPAALALLDWAGGVNGTEPGETHEATAILESGDYLMVCFIPDEQGVSHVAHGMVAPLQVGPKSDIAPPVADQTVTLADYSVTLPADFTGTGPYEVKNTGQEYHELILLRLQDGKTLDDLGQWAAGGSKGPAPYDMTGGVGTIAPGTSAWTTLDLRAGNYVALCVITSPTTMQQHVQMGMITPFVIA